MEQVALTVHIPRTLHAAAERVSRQRGQTLDRFLAQALARGVLRNAADEPADRDTGPGAGSDSTDGQAALARLRGDLEQDFARARSWPELQGRLLVKGYRLRECGGALSVHRHPDDTRLCPLESLGITSATLAMRFCRPFPPPIGMWEQSPFTAGERGGIDAALQAIG
ncbi:hypothetical protein [Maliponia aquimaris]|uniref:Uncharacterized protein n=1 Tax=Maliponia aquimaris TaxID=1673631 RepID=A0A238KW36_9RHOB|nr:hypothetical protein [Maliponia aquimaris]SMX46801.1 hypothetical protein MAA8898_03529 [Maliponia aquimaris]